MSSSPSSLDAIRQLLSRRQGVVATYLFGSAARDASRPRDLDLAVMFTRGVDGFREALTVQVLLETQSGVPVDVHDFDALPVDLQFRVLDEGTVVVDQDPKARVRREVAATFAYYDFRPYLDRIRSGALQRLTGGAQRG